MLAKVLFFMADQGEDPLQGVDLLSTSGIFEMDVVSFAIQNGLSTLMEGLEGKLTERESEIILGIAQVINSSFGEGGTSATVAIVGDRISELEDYPERIALMRDLMSRVAASKALAIVASRLMDMHEEAGSA